MFQKDAEHVRVASRELLLDFVGQPVRVGIGRSPGSAPRGVFGSRLMSSSLYITFSPVRVQLDERPVDLVDGRRVEPPVRLVADPVDAQLARLEIAERA